MPEWIKHPAVVAAFVAGLFGIVVAIVNIARDYKPEPYVIVQTGGLYRDSYHEDGSWQAYLPQIHNRERFWIGLNILPRKEVTVDTFSVGGVQFECFGYGYDNQEMRRTVDLVHGTAVWIAVPIELDQWDEFRGILSSKTICLLLDTRGRAVAKYELPAMSFPQE